MHPAAVPGIRFSPSIYANRGPSGLENQTSDNCGILPGLPGILLQPPEFFRHFIHGQTLPGGRTWTHLRTPRRVSQNSVARAHPLSSLAFLTGPLVHERPVE